MAKNGSFKCTICGRSFGMAAHLGRHMNTIHGAKRGRPGPNMGARRTIARPAMGSAGGPEFASEVRNWRAELVDQRQQIDAQLAALDHLLGTLGG